MKKRNRLAPILSATVLSISLSAVFPVKLPAEPLSSPSWGFQFDLPEGYRYVTGNGKEQFSFNSPEGASFEVIVYPPGTRAYPSLEAMAGDVQKRLHNQGDISYFKYRDKKAVLLELDFQVPAAGKPAQNIGRNARLTGWGLCLELETPEQGTGAKTSRNTPLLLALAYGAAEKEELRLLHLSALDSLAPSNGDRRAPGPITEFTYPRGNRITIPLAGLGVEAPAYEHDDTGAQALVDREFEVLKRSADAPGWKDAWTRFYRAIYRDSFGRLGEIAFTLERYWNTPDRADPASYEQKRRELAAKALEWVQSFAYERDLAGSDFVNPVRAAAQGRGDCDSRAMLWAIILERANIPTAIMVSADYSHAMGLTDLPGSGARFGWEGVQWLVAETTAPVSLGLIGKGVSDPAHWLGIIFQ